MTASTAASADPTPGSAAPAGAAVAAPAFAGPGRAGPGRAGPGRAGPGRDTPSFELAGPWLLHPQVALRPESFGALAYHFGNRRLSFLKSRRLLAVVEALADHPDPEAACRAAGVPAAELPSYRRALAALAASEMIVPRGKEAA